MSLIDRLAKGARAISFQDVYGKGLDLTDTFDGAGSFLNSTSTAAGIRVTSDIALRMTTVYACVRLLSQTIASLPIDTYRKNGDLREPVEPPQWLLTPNPEITRFEYFERIMASALLDGNGYTAVVRASRPSKTAQIGDPLEIWPIHPLNARPERDQSGQLVLRISDGVGNAVLRYHEFVHLRAFTLGGIKGINPIQYAKQAIGLSLAAEEHGAAFFGRGSTLPGVIETPFEMNDERAKALKAGWTRDHGGRKKSHLPGVLSGGATWKQTAIPNDQAQFLETRKFQVVEICRLFGVPPHMVMDVERSTSWGAGIEEQSIQFVVYALRPWLEKIEQSMRWLLPPGVYMRFNVEGLLRGDTKSRYEAYTQARNAGWLNIDEIRAKEDLPPVPGGVGQDHIQPLNMGPLGSDPLASKAAGATPAKGARTYEDALEAMLDAARRDQSTAAARETEVARLEQALSDARSARIEIENDAAGRPIGLRRVV